MTPQLFDDGPMRRFAAALDVIRQQLRAGTAAPTPPAPIPSIPFWATYCATRWGDCSLALYQTEQAAWWGVWKWIDVSDLTQEEADAFLSLARTDPARFRKQFMTRLPDGYTVLVTEVPAVAG